MRRRITLAIFLGVTPLLLGASLHSWTWFFAGLTTELVVLLLWISPFNRFDKRNVTPQELADELERHSMGSEGPYDWDATTSLPIADERLNRLIPMLIEYDRLDTPEKRQQFREIIEALRRGEIPD